MVKTKVCSGCKRELPITEFWKSKANADGLQIYCKACKYEKDRSSRHKRQIKRREERLKLKENAQNIKEMKKAMSWCNPLGGYKISIQNYARSGEFKYNILQVGGKLYTTNDKAEFMKYLRAI